MFRIVRACNRASGALRRREFLTASGLGLLSLGTQLGSSRLMGAEVSSHEQARLTFGRAKRCLLLFLTGGPPQHDTWDLKPKAPAEIRGELKPIATNVAGIQVSELFPKLAQQADKYCIMRSVTHEDTVHTSAGYTMLTGVVHPMANSPTAELIHPSPNDHPHVGSLLAQYRFAGTAITGTPPVISLPEYIRDAGINDFPGQTAGMLGRAYDPFLISANDARTGFRAPDIELPADITANRLADRRYLLRQLDKMLANSASGESIAGFGQLQQQTFDLLRSNRMRTAFQLDQEPAALREAYGSHLFGMGCLLARRLLEVGVTLATVYWHYEGPEDSPVWDTHWNNFPHLRQRLMPPTDQAVSTLLADLHTRGMLDDTLVICMGEFGRTPRINGKGGRDHWPHVQSILLAGAGIRGGQVYGESDATGAYPKSNPVVPVDLTATILHLLGVPANFEIHDRFGRPLRACTGAPVLGIL